MRRAKLLLSALAALAAPACHSPAPRERAAPLVLRDLAAPAAQESAAQDEAALLDVPDYADRGEYLSGDWGGARTELAQDGVLLDGQFTQYAQGLVAGGLSDHWHFPAALDLVAELDMSHLADWDA